jgi:hypothetical protein
MAAAKVGVRKGGRRSSSPAEAGTGETGGTARTFSWSTSDGYLVTSKKPPAWRRYQKQTIEWVEEELRQAEREGRPFNERKHFLIRGLIEIAKLAALPKGQQPKDPAQAWYEENEIIRARVWRDREVERGEPKKTATKEALEKAAAATDKSVETVRGLFHSPQVREIARLTLLMNKRQREKVLKRVAALLLKTRNE